MINYMIAAVVGAIVGVAVGMLYMAKHKVTNGMLGELLDKAKLTGYRNGIEDAKKALQGEFVRGVLRVIDMEEGKDE